MEKANTVRNRLLERSLAVFRSASAIVREIKSFLFTPFRMANKSKEKQDLREKSLHMISCQNFTPGPGHRVCSKHFTGGRKTYMNNIPTIVPKNKGEKETKEIAK